MSRDSSHTEERKIKWTIQEEKETLLFRILLFMFASLVAVVPLNESSQFVSTLHHMASSRNSKGDVRTDMYTGLWIHHSQVRERLSPLLCRGFISSIIIMNGAHKLKQPTHTHRLPIHYITLEHPWLPIKRAFGFKLT